MIRAGDLLAGLVWGGFNTGGQQLGFMAEIKGHRDLLVPLGG